MADASTRPQTERISFGPMMVDWEPRLDFAKMLRDRQERARDAMKAADVQYLILSRFENGRYVTGIKRLHWPTIRLGGPVVILPLEGLPGIWNIDPTFASKTMPNMPPDRFFDNPEMDLSQDVEKFARQALNLFGADFEKARIGVDIWSPAMFEVLPRVLPDATFVDGQEGVMLRAREIKTPEEITCLKMGYVYSEAVMQAALEIFKPGVRECELVGTAFKRMTDFGSETSQCSTNVNSGPGTWPYRRFHTDRIIQAGDMVNMDFGACFNGYFGDFTRAFVCGRKPTPAQLDLHKAAYEQQMENFEVIKPGESPAALIKKLGRKGKLGHGIGISAFESPHLRPSDDFEIKPGMTFSVTTTLGKEGVGGIHLEDETVVTETGLEVYSTFPYAYLED